MGEPFGSKEIILNEEEGRVNRHRRPPEPQKLTLSCPLAGSAGRGWHEEPSTAPLSFSEGLPAQGLGSTLQVYPSPQLPSAAICVPDTGPLGCSLRWTGVNPELKAL